MADINLLQPRSLEQTQGRSTATLAVIGYFILAIMVLGGIALLVLAKQTDSNIAKATLEKQTRQNEITSMNNYGSLLDTQDKLNQLSSIIDRHLYWSSVIPNYAAATLKGTYLTRFTANKDGGITISGHVNNFQDLNKLIQGMQLADSKEKTQIKDIKLISVGLSDEESGGLIYNLKVVFNTDLLRKAVSAQ